MMIPPDFILLSAPYAEDYINAARRYIKEVALTAEDVKIVHDKAEDMILVKTKRQVVLLG